MPPDCVTTRLIGRPLAPHDEAFLQAMHRDERLMATLGGVRDAAATRTYLERNLAHWETHGFGTRIWIERDTGRPVGRGGLRHFLLEDIEEIELGYALLPEFWGRGLATELARALVAAGPGPVAAESLVGVTLPTNLASARVLEKAGFVYERDALHAGLTHRVFRHRGAGRPAA